MNVTVNEQGKIIAFNTPNCTVPLPDEALGTWFEAWTYTDNSWIFDAILNEELNNQIPPPPEV